MKRIPPTDNHSQFIITFKAMEGLDHKNVVFGKVIKGNDNLFKIQDYARQIGKPYAEIIISNCGEIQRANFENVYKSGVQGISKRNVGVTASKEKGKVGYAETSVKNCKCLPSCSVKSSL